jgi:phage protein D
MSDLTSTAPLYSAQPILALDGQAEPTLSRGLISLVVHETVDGIYRCEANFGNWGSIAGEVGFLYFDRQVFDFGRQLTIRIGDGDAAADIFDGRITAIEGRFPGNKPPELLILAEDRLQDLRMVRRSRTFEEVEITDVIRQIAGDHGLRADVDLNGPRYRVLAQVNQSDLAFLHERVRAVDAEVWVEGNTLKAQPRSQRRTNELSLTYGQRLREFSSIADLAHQRTRFGVGGWDVQAKESLFHEVNVTSIRGELDGGSSGSQILEEAFGDRPERIVHLTPGTSQEARELAEAFYKRTARQFLKGRGVAEGDGRLRAGSHVELAGLGELFNGRYYVTEVSHTFSTTAGLRTGFRVERPWLGGS